PRTEEPRTQEPRTQEPRTRTPNAERRTPNAVPAGLDAAHLRSVPRSDAVVAAVSVSRATARRPGGDGAGAAHRVAVHLRRPHQRRAGRRRVDFRHDDLAAL